MDRNMAVVLIVFIVVLFGAVTYSGALSTNKTITAVNAGLEECPMEIGSSRTIWVRDCLAYSDKMKEIK